MMAAFSAHSNTLIFHLLISVLLILWAKPSLSMPPQTLVDDPIFRSEIAVFGDAKIINGGSEVQLTLPHALSSGLILRKTPFKLVEGNAAKPTSFSTDFAFSPGNGNDLAFVLVGSDFESRFVGRGLFGLRRESRFVGVEFNTKNDGIVGDLNANHVEIDVGSLESVRVSNVPTLDLLKNNGEKLKAWIDYEASPKILEVRLSRFDERKPYNPILAYHVDLLKKWGNEDVFVGIASTNVNSSQSSSVYSWSFRLRVFPTWMHSLPVDPRAQGHVDKDDDGARVTKGGFRCLRILAGVIFATGCGALLAYVVLFVWAISVGRHNVFPAECQKGNGDFKYEKISVISDKDVKGNNN